MINNSGIINIGNNNINNITNNLNYQKIEQELTVLLNYTKEQELIKDAVKASKEKDNSKLKKVLKRLSKETIALIKELKLIFLENIIEQIFFK